LPDPSDRRQSERYPVTSDTACTFAGQVAQDLGSVRIKNVSMEGIGLLTTKSVDVGAVLVVGISNKARAFSRVMLVRVAHVTAQMGGTFLVGGTFETPLTYQDLTTLVM
jgi:hypothetical protein